MLAATHTVCERPRHDVHVAFSLIEAGLMPERRRETALPTHLGPGRKVLRTEQQTSKADFQSRLPKQTSEPYIMCGRMQ
eukprot:2778537-Heterocapsa_arctica.AAC.1